MKQIFLGFALVTLGFGGATVLFNLGIVIKYQKLNDTANAQLNTSRGQVNDCVKRLDEAHAMNLVCTNQTKEALRLGEECTALLYYMPIEAIQQVRDKLLNPDGVFTPPDTGSAFDIEPPVLITPGIFDQ